MSSSKFEISTLKLTYFNGMTKPTLKCLNMFEYLKTAPDYSCHDWYQFMFLTSQIESYKDLAFFFLITSSDALSMYLFERNYMASATVTRMLSSIVWSGKWVCGITSCQWMKKGDRRNMHGKGFIASAYDHFFCSDLLLKIRYTFPCLWHICSLQKLDKLFHGWICLIPHMYLLPHNLTPAWMSSKLVRQLPN